MKRKIIEEWIAKAEQDYDALKILSRQRKHRVFDTICFHAQQCAEKYLKALIVFHRVSLPKIHDLGKLADLLQPFEPSIGLMTDLYERLSPYGVEFRYPGEEAIASEARIAIAAAKEIRRFVRDRLNLSR